MNPDFSRQSRTHRAVTVTLLTRAVAALHARYFAVKQGIHSVAVRALLGVLDGAITTARQLSTRA